MQSLIKFTSIPEWLPHNSIYLAWPLYDNVLNSSVSDFYLSLIATLTKYVKVRLLVLSEESKLEIQSLLNSKKIDSTSIIYKIMPYDNIWIRDYGPIYVKNHLNELGIVDFQYNSYGYPEESILTENIHRIIAKENNIPLIPISLICEGGAWETNENSIILTESVQFSRNPKLNKIDIETQFVNSLNAKEIIWLKRGVPEDFHASEGKLFGKYFTACATGGHTDEFVRFINSDTILLAQIDKDEAKQGEIQALGYEILEEAYNILSKKWKIIRIPVPDLLTFECNEKDPIFDFMTKIKYKDGSQIQKNDKINVIMATSYLNYLVTNGVVVAQKYWKNGRSDKLKEKDEKVRQILQECFPDRDIVQLDAESVNQGGGGIHCITMQEPLI